MQFGHAHAIGFGDGVQGLPLFDGMVNAVRIVVLIRGRLLIRKAAAIGEGHCQKQAKGGSNQNLSGGDHGGGG